MAIAGGAISYFSSSGGSKVLPDDQVGEFNAGIPYGASPQEVLQKLGSPTKKQAACWLYRADGNRIHGVYAGPRVDAMKFCFSDRVVSFIYSHDVAFIWHKRRIPAQWVHPIDIEPGVAPPSAAQRDAN